MLWSVGQLGRETLDHSQRSRTFRVRSLSGDRLLRLLLEGAAFGRSAEAAPYLALLLLCDSCGNGVIDLFGGSPDPCPCLECGGGTCVPVSGEELRKWSERIRRACARDRQLLPRAKASYKQIHGEDCGGPTFKGPFAWLTMAWESAGLPRGRPFALGTYLEVAHLALFFRANGVTYEALAGLCKEHQNPLATRITWERIEQRWQRSNLRAERLRGIERLPESDWQAVLALRRNKLKKTLESLLDEPEWPADFPATRRDEWIRHRAELLAILRHREEIGRAVGFARDYLSEPWKRLGYQRIRPRVKPGKNP